MSIRLVQIKKCKTYQSAVIFVHFLIKTYNERMSNKEKYNPNIHHRKSIRLQGYDYSQAGLYFITILTDDRQHLFGTVSNGVMALHTAGEVAQNCWLEIPNHYPSTVLHEFVVMPNHIHGIIELTTMQYDKNRNAFQDTISKSIGSIIRGYKIGVTKWVRQNTSIQTVWHKNFYENIIRDANAYHLISEYIINNPVNWQNDGFYATAE